MQKNQRRSFEIIPSQEQKGKKKKKGRKPMGLSQYHQTD